MSSSDRECDLLPLFNTQTSLTWTEEVATKRRLDGSSSSQLEIQSWLSCLKQK